MARNLSFTAALMTHCVMAGGAATLPSMASGHHSFGLYARGLTEIQGELVSTEWSNPHIYFTVRATNAEGQTVLWRLEAGAPYSLQRRGITQTLFLVGDAVRVAGRAHTREEGRMWVDNMLLGDGREILVDGGSDPRWNTDPIGRPQTKQPINALAENRGFFRVWSEQSIVHGQRLPFRDTVSRIERPELIARLDEYAARCEPMGMPSVMGTPHPVELVDRGSTVQLLGLSNNARIDRVIYMGGEMTPARKPASSMGYSIGRWEGSRTFVVTTTQIDWPYFSDDRGIVQSEAVSTTEVFTLSEDQARLHYQMTVADPMTFLEPAVTLAIDWLALGETLAEPADCPPNN
jgi:Family of unknown function (DUF6152)